PHVDVYVLQSLILRSSLYTILSLDSLRPHLHPPPFPTRRSSDLSNPPRASLPYTPKFADSSGWMNKPKNSRASKAKSPKTFPSGDRKSTRLNSSHGSISYAVFGLKKKKTTHQPIRKQRRGRPHRL